MNPTRPLTRFVFLIRWCLIVAICVLVGWASQLRQTPLWSIKGLPNSSKFQVAEAERMVVITEPINGQVIRFRKYDIMSGRLLGEQVLSPTQTPFQLIGVHGPKLLISSAAPDRPTPAAKLLTVIERDGTVLLNRIETQTDFTAQIVGAGNRLFVTSSDSKRIELTKIPASPQSGDAQHETITIPFEEDEWDPYLSGDRRFAVISKGLTSWRICDCETGLELGRHQMAKKAADPIPVGATRISRSVNHMWWGGNTEFGYTIHCPSAFQLPNGDKCCSPDELMIMRLRNGKFVYERDPERSLVHIYPKPDIAEIVCKRCSEDFFERVTFFSKRPPIIERVRTWAEQIGLHDYFDRLLADRAKPDRRLVELIRAVDGKPVLSLLSSNLRLRPYPKLNLVIGTSFNGDERRVYRLQPLVPTWLSSILVALGMFVIVMVLGFLTAQFERIRAKSKLRKA